MSSLIPHQLFNETVKSGTDILEDKAQIENLAKETHLTVQETVMWLNHLKGVRAKRNCKCMAFYVSSAILIANFQLKV